MRLLILILFILNSVNTNAQNKIKQFEHYTLTDKKDQIDFIVLKQQKDEKKPVLLFCQGSQPIPLFVKMYDDTIGLALSNFDIAHMSKFYHIVVISKPFTPVIADTSQINDAYNYVTDKYSNPYSYDISYLKNDTKEITARRAKKVWQFLKKQSWVDKSTFVVAGHSQGAREAVEIAFQNKDVTKLGLFSFSPDGRFEESMRRIRKSAEQGEISWEKADMLWFDVLSLYDQTLGDYNDLYNNPSFYSWKSFNEPSLPKLLKIKIPIYVAYGSEDITSVNCDMLEFHFLKVSTEKFNSLRLKRYGGLEHNFFPLKEDKTPDYDNPNWEKVMNAFIDWSVKK